MVSYFHCRNFRELTKLMSEEDNFAAYRNEVDNLMNQKAPCLPFLGDFLTQIAQTQTYLSCRKKTSPESRKNEAATQSDPSPTTPTPARVEKHSPRGNARSRTSLIKRRGTPTKIKDSRFSKSSPNLPASCTRTPERSSQYRSNRCRRCRSWQHSSNDSGIQVSNSNNSSLYASSASFLTSNTSLGSGTFAFHSKNNGTSSDNQRSQNLGRSSSTNTPVSSRGSRRFRLRRNQSVSEKCLSHSDNGTLLKTRLSFMRSFRRSKSMDQSPSSAESIQKLCSAKLENGVAPGKTPDVNEVGSIHAPEATDETGNAYHTMSVQRTCFCTWPC